MNNQKKLEFLDQLLQKNPDLQEQYNEFAKQDSPISVSELAKDDAIEAETFILEEVRELIMELESLNLSDPDWEQYIPRHNGYIEEWEAQMHMAEDKVADVLDDYEAGIINLLSKGKVNLALLSLVAGHEACLKADLQDEYETLGDVSFYLKGEAQEMQENVIQELKTVVFSNRQVYDFLAGFFTYFKKHHRENEEYLRFFEPLLLALAGDGDTDKERAATMSSLLDDKQIPRSYIPQVAAELYKITENREKWLEESEGLVELDAKVARNVLEEYSQSSYDDFNRVAQKLWQAGRFKETLASSVFENIEQDRSPKLYKKVLLWLTAHTRAIDKYKLLRKVLTDEEKESFIEAHKNNYVFYTRMLKQEQRDDEILEFIKRNRDSWHLNNMLRTIIDSYPKESFTILEQKILTTLETERGRRVYKQIVEWLQLASSINNMEERTQHLIQHLYNWKPALPALKDELRKAGWKNF